MSNHFHLVVETPKGNLVAGMKWFLGTYTARFNRRHKLFGHLFSGRYKSLIVDGSANKRVRNRVSPGSVLTFDTPPKKEYQLGLLGTELNAQTRMWDVLHVKGVLSFDN